MHSCEHMASRDPETGQFVSGAAGLPGYQNLEIQLVENSLSAQSDLLSGTTFLPQWDSFEPVGGLQRDERAELVGIRGVEVLEHSAIGGNDQPGGMALGYELSMDPERFGGRDSADEQDIQGVTGIDKAILVAVEPDIVRIDHFNVSNEFDSVDSTNGTGTGGGGTTTDRRIVDWNLRDQYGRGPVLDRHDQLYMHSTLRKTGDSNSNYDFHVIYLLAWHVTEAE